ncbi:hypothetical protein RBB78_24810 (plasmid) [Tunturiibacter empetritectus]|uniref:hypothetical protein n=1 Tax=Tunturiibacter empetritectus TaxID=3069691 RepID=UPI003D9B6BD3
MTLFPQAAMTAGMVGTAIVFFPAAPLLLLIHGKDITIPKGTEVTAFMGTPHETEIYVRLQRVSAMFSIVYPDSDNELRPIQGRRILYLDLAE